MKKLIQLIIVIVIAVIAITLGYLYVHHQNEFPSTEDAFIQANIVNIAPEITGHVASVNVKENQAVKQGQILFTIDPHPFLIALSRAKSQLADTISKVAALESAAQSASATVTAQAAAMVQANKQYNRFKALYKQGNVSATQMDDATSQHNQATADYHASVAKYQQALKELGDKGTRNAQVQAALADVAQAKLDLSHTIIRAPADGIVSNLTLRPGDEVTTAQNLFAIIESQHWWAQANYKETQLARLKPGQTATITLDMYPDETLVGTVQSIGSGSGDTFALLPAENATGNWVKVSQRFPVRITIDPHQAALHHPLRVGASSQVTVDTTH